MHSTHIRWSRMHSTGSSFYSHLVFTFSNQIIYSGDFTTVVPNLASNMAQTYAAAVDLTNKDELE